MSTDHHAKLHTAHTGTHEKNKNNARTHTHTHTHQRGESELTEKKSPNEGTHTHTHTPFFTDRVQSERETNREQREKDLSGVPSAQPRRCERRE